MPIATYIFLASLAGLVAMGVSKWSGLQSGRPGFLSILSRFDSAIGGFLLRFSVFLQRLNSSLRSRLKAFIRSFGQALTLYLHTLLQSAERRARMWREFARERKIERRSASGFIKDVFEYKNQIKQNGNHSSPEQ